MEHYDPEKSSSYIAYFDVNNMHGLALSQYLPYKDFRWIPCELFDVIIEKINSEDEGSPVGFFLEVDLEYLSDLSDEHSDYPLAPERIPVTEDMYCPYKKQLVEVLEEVGRKVIPTEKLIPNLRDKTKYVVHSHTLKFYLSKGMRLKKVHRIISFTQRQWLHPYIVMCTSKRMTASNEFEKDFWKLIVNALYGKSIEDKRKHFIV